MEKARNEEGPDLAATGPPIFRVFLSSPSDVGPERKAADDVVHRLRERYAERVDLRLERWELKFYEATKSFQEQIESMAGFRPCHRHFLLADRYRAAPQHLPPGRRLFL